MNSYFCCACFSLACALTVSSALASDCSSSLRDRSDYVSATLINALDQGRDANGLYPSWVERYIRDAEMFGEALTSYCARSPQQSLDVAFAEIAGTKP